MADSNGIPVVSGLFQIIKAPFKFVKSVGETGLSALTLDGEGAVNGFKGMGNSIFDVGEGAFDAVSDIAGAGKSLFNTAHFDETAPEAEESKRVTRLIPKKDMHKGEEAKAPDSAVTSPIVREETPVAPVVPPEIIIEDIPEEGPIAPPVNEAPVVPPANEDDAVPPVAVVPEEPIAPPADDQDAPDTIPPVAISPAPEEAAPAAPGTNDGSKAKTILKYVAIGVGIIVGALLLRKVGKSLFSMFSKSKDSMIDHTSLYEALKGKPTPTLKAQQTVAGNVGKVAPDPIKAESLLKGGKVTPALTGPTTTPLLTGPTSATTKTAEEAAKAAKEEAAKEAKDAVAKQVAATKARLKAGEKLATPKSPIGLTDKYAAIGENAPKQVHNISKEEVTKLTEKAQNQVYKEKVVQEVREQAKARAKKSAEDAARIAQEAAAEDAARIAQEDAAKKAQAAAAKRAQEKAERAASTKYWNERYKASRKKIAEQLKAEKLSVKTEIKDLKVSIREYEKERTLLQKKTVLTVEEAARRKELTGLIKSAKSKMQRREKQLAKLMGQKTTLSQTVKVAKETSKFKKTDIAAKTVKKTATSTSTAAKKTTDISIEELLKKTGAYEGPVGDEILFIGSYIA